MDYHTKTPVFTRRGKCSSFGGPHDTGMALTEGLALWEPAEVLADVAPKCFIYPFNPSLGLGRQLDPSALYCAMRWNYALTPKHLIRSGVCVVTATSGRKVTVIPVDWGPNVRTGRIIDLSPGALSVLGIGTDSVVDVAFYL